MYQRDYLLRLIEQLTAVIGQMTGLKRERNFEQAHTVMDDWLGRQFGLSLKLIHALSARDLMAMLRTNEIVEAGKTVAVAKLLSEEADLYELEHRELDWHRAKSKALHLLAVVSAYGPQGYDPDPDVVAMYESLKGYELPPETLRELFAFMERSGRWPEAENLLFERAEMDDPSAIEDGETFYASLLARSDAELEAAGLPREEVQAGLEDLRRLSDARATPTHAEGEPGE